MRLKLISIHCYLRNHLKRQGPGVKTIFIVNLTIKYFVLTLRDTFIASLTISKNVMRLLSKAPTVILNPLSHERGCFFSVNPCGPQAQAEKEKEQGFPR